MRLWMRAGVIAVQIALLGIAGAGGKERTAERAPRPEGHRARVEGTCYLRFGQNTACIAAGSEEQCQQACDERRCDEIVWYPRPACREWRWIGPSPR